MTEFDVAAARQMLLDRDMSEAEAERVLAKDLLSVSEVAHIRKVDPPVARNTLRAWGVKSVAREPGWPGEGLYTAAEVWHAIQKNHLGKGWRKGQPGPISDKPPRQVKVTPEIQARILEVSKTSPAELDQPFATWTMSRLAAYLKDNEIASVSRETVRKILAADLPGSKPAGPAS